jgi:butyrate kinase
MQMSEASYKILAINPGSTSTKIAVYENERAVVEDTIRHSEADLDSCGSISGQKNYRLGFVLGILDQAGIGIESIDAVVGRGGLVKPIESGVYRVNDRMLSDLEDSAAALHASMLGGVIAHEIGIKYGIPAYVVDPIVVDELDQNARLTGFPGIERKSIFHALNQKAVARKCAKDMGVPYENCRFIVAHMGGGISVGAHRYGRVVDVNDALSGEGAFTPERTGSLPALPLIDLCFSGVYTKQELVDRITKKGGMMAYLGTNDLRKCENMIKEGDEHAALVFESMAYQVSKEIGAMSTVLDGKVDAIILTGGLAYSNQFTGSIRQKVGLIAPVKVYPGEDEMNALVSGALRVLRGEEKASEY